MAFLSPIILLSSILVSVLVNQPEDVATNFYHVATSHPLLLADSSDDGKTGDGSPSDPRGGGDRRS